MIGSFTHRIRVRNSVNFLLTSDALFLLKHLIPHHHILAYVTCRWEKKKILVIATDVYFIQIWSNAIIANDLFSCSMSQSYNNVRSSYNGIRDNNNPRKGILIKFDHEYFRNNILSKLMPVLRSVRNILERFRAQFINESALSSMLTCLL